jgi:hypothetical protein
MAICLAPGSKQIPLCGAKYIIYFNGGVWSRTALRGGLDGATQRFGITP